MNGLMVYDSRVKVLENWLSQFIQPPVRIASINFDNFSIVHFRMFNSPWVDDGLKIAYDQIDFCVRVTSQSIEILSTSKKFYIHKEFSMLSDKYYVDDYGHTIAF